MGNLATSSKCQKSKTESDDSKALSTVRQHKQWYHTVQQKGHEMESWDQPKRVVLPCTALHHPAADFLDRCMTFHTRSGTLPSQLEGCCIGQIHTTNGEVTGQSSQK